jgi:hypothetical protein
MTGRHRGQARSHRDRGISRNQVGCEAAFASRLAPTVWGGYIWKRLVGCQAAIAGKPAPTGTEGTAEIRSTVRPLSRASPLPQGPREQRKSGRLSGRLREQARSHRDRGNSGNQVSCQAAFASRLAPTVWGGYIWKRLVGWQAAIAGEPCSYRKAHWRTPTTQQAER